MEFTKSCELLWIHLVLNELLWGLLINGYIMRESTIFSELFSNGFRVIVEKYFYFSWLYLVQFIKYKNRMQVGV